MKTGGSSEIAISATNVHMYFFVGNDMIRAVQGASFEVRRGEVFGLLGPDGSGKSSILRLLAGQLAPTDGKIRILGRRPRRGSVRRRIGYLPQVNQPEPLAGWKRLLLLPKELLGNSRKRNLVASPSASSDRPSDARFAKVLLGNPEILLL